mgnify:CR=1 FL=1
MPDMRSKVAKVKKLIFPDTKAKPDPMEKAKITPQAAAKIRKKASVILGAGTEY